jgi:hypothetical protein
MLPRIDIREILSLTAAHDGGQPSTFSLIIASHGAPGGRGRGVVVFRSLAGLKRAICATIAAASFGFLGHSDPAVADFLTEPGGSNLVFISQHEYTPLPLGSVEAGNCLNAMGDARSVIAVYDVAKAAIDAKLRSLYAAGQRKISLVLWHFFNQYSYAPPQTTYLNTFCEMVVADGVLTTRCHTRPRKEFHFGICSNGRIALATRPTSWMFLTSVHIFPTHRAARLTHYFPHCFFSLEPSFIKITFITPMVSPTASTQLLDPIRGVPSRGFPQP